MKYLKYAASALLLCLSTASNAEIKHSEKTKAIAGLSENIVGVYTNDTDDAMELVLAYKTIWNSESVLFGAAGDMLEIMKKMVSQRLVPERERIRFTVAIPLRDKYGNTKITKAISVTYLADELLKVKYESRNMLPPTLLDLYEKVWRLDPVSTILINDYCRSNLSNNSFTFCRNEYI